MRARKVCSVAVVFVLLLMLLTAYGPAVRAELQTTVVDGTTYFQLATEEDLYQFSELVRSDYATYGAANAVVTADITVNRGVLRTDGSFSGGTFRTWTPIGGSATPYTGIFDGGGHAVSGLDAGDLFASGVGLFGYIGEGGTVQDLVVTDSYFCGKQYVGGVAGHNEGTVTGCRNESMVTAGSINGDIGGVTGYNGGTVTLSANSGTVNGYNLSGGVAGSNAADGRVQSCYNTGAVKGTGTEFGGIAGRNEGSVLDCYNTGAISGKSAVGSVVGAGTATNCYYLAGSAQDSSGTAQNGIGSATPGTAAGDPEDIRSRTAGDFSSGAVCYLLNSEKTDGTQVWYQNLDNCALPDAGPAFSGGTVYAVATGIFDDNGFQTEEAGYSNSATGQGAYRPAFLVSAGNAAALGLSAEYAGFYAVSNAGQLYWFAEKVNGDYENYGAADVVLTADITVNSPAADTGDTEDPENVSIPRVWTPIGTQTAPYGGLFDGGSHTVRGLHLEGGTDSYVGLVGCVGETGAVCQVRVQDVCFAGADFVGGVAGANYGTLDRVSVNGLVSGAAYVGGVTGQNCGTVTNSYNTATVSGTSNTGGLAGSCPAGSCIQNCYNAGMVQMDGETGYALCGSREGTAVNCFFLYNTEKTEAENAAAESDGCKVKTEAAFGSGEVTYLLGEAFGQSLAAGGDARPVFATGYNAVYIRYSTSSFDTNGFSKGIGYGNAETVRAFQPAEETTEKYDVDGVGGFDTVYEISNAGQLYWFSEKVRRDAAAFGAANAVLTADITVNRGVLLPDGTVTTETEDFLPWMPVGTPESPFGGIFDGRGRTVSGLYYSGTDSQVGLFGQLTGTVRNVGVLDSYFSGEDLVGGVAGQNSGTVQYCYAACQVRGTGHQVGMLVGGGDGTLRSGFYLAATEDGKGGKTAGQFASGEVCYLLNDGISDGTQVWHQSIGTETYPGYAGQTVCFDAETGYYNIRAVLRITQDGSRVAVSGLCEAASLVLASYVGQELVDMRVFYISESCEKTIADSGLRIAGADEIKAFLWKNWNNPLCKDVRAALR